MIRAAAQVWGGWMAAMSWQVAILALGIAALSTLFRAASPRVLYLLWLLAFVKLVVPPQWGHAYSAASLVSKSVAVAAPARAGSESAAPSPIHNAAGWLAESPETPSDSSGFPPAPVRPSRARLALTPTLFAVWLAGIAALIAHSLIALLRFRRWLARCSAPAPAWLEAAVGASARKIGLRSAPPCLVAPGGFAPCVFGWRRPVLLFPTALLEEMPREQLRLAVFHELLHIRRGDTLMNVAQRFVQLLYWFHPLVWLAGREVRRYREMETDEAVASASGESSRPEYGKAILAMAERSRLAPVPSIMGILEPHTFVFWRVARLLQAPGRRGQGVLNALGWASLAAIAIFLAPMGVVRSALAQAAASPSPAATPQSEFDHLLTEPQRLYAEWTEQTFASILDHGELAKLSDTAKAEMEAVWLEKLKGSGEGPWSRHEVAINSLGAIKSKKAVAPLLLIAADPTEKDNADRCMATRALGLIGDASVVPALIHLVYHYNQNTRFWAQISLVRLTGVNFGTDWQAWGKWWNEQGRQPAFSPEKVEWAKSPEAVEYSRPEVQQKADEEFIQNWKSGGSKSEEAPAPRIVQTVPPVGAKDVDPALAGITVTFDQEMDTSGYAWTGGGELYPKTTGNATWQDARTCVLPVALEAGHFYRVGINSTSFKNFCGKNGVSVEDSAIYFATVGATPEMIAALTAPRIVSMNPENGAKGVSLATTELRVTFDQKMGGGFSWCKIGRGYPQTTGKPRWEPDQMTCVLPVALQPNASFQLGINYPGYINFTSAYGVPVEPVVYTFETEGQSAARAEASDSTIPADVRKDVTEAIDLLSQTMETQTDRVKQAFDLVRRHPRDQALAALIPWLDDKEATRRRSAVYMIQMLPWDDPAPAFAPLRKLLTHEEPLTRGMAGMALASLGDKKSYDSLANMLAKDDDPYARRCAAWALGELGDEKALPALQTALGDRDGSVKANAQNAIERLTFLRENKAVDGDAAQVVRGVWLISGSTPYQQERLAQAMALIQSADRSVSEGILTGLKSSEMQSIKNSALLALAGMKGD
ncbi:MAG: HEAT repeat domain-containing protein [Candidatus Sumerlaeota bacterium]|nr:HEAT repeat domain-containing protein [Candidatus Sumerlaeota bacterium]